MGETEYEKERAQERAEEIEEAIAQEHRAQAEAEAKQKAREAERAAADAAAGSPAEVGGPEEGLTDLPGIGKKLLEALTAGGFDTIEKIAAATKEQLMEVPKIGEKTAERILAAAQGRLQGQGKQAEGDQPVEEEAGKPSQTAG